ncbi:hypothetical protein GJ496_003229 [Pomphorhynchus laevis]|nr:hypothetical protein GJ496_003229 [Pomphorhynchus laevis]
MRRLKSEEIVRDGHIVFMRYIFSWIGIIIGIPGIIGNVLILCVQTDLHSSSITIYLMALTVCNVTFLYLWLGTHSLRYVLAVKYIRALFAFYDGTHWYVKFATKSQKLTIPLINISQLCFILITTAISVDRCLCLYKSLRSARYASQQVSIRMIWLIVIFSIVYSMPSWFEYEYFIEKSATSNIIGRLNETIVKLKLTKFGERHIKLLHQYLYIPIKSDIENNVNCWNIQQMREISRRTKFLNKLSQSYSRLRKTIWAIMVMFFVCQSPILMLNVFTSIITTCHSSEFSKVRFISNIKLEYLLSFVRCVCDLLMVLNASTNFVLYCCCCNHFKQTVLKKIKCILHG